MSFLGSMIGGLKDVLEKAELILSGTPVMFDEHEHLGSGWGLHEHVEITRAGSEPVGSVQFDEIDDRYRGWKGLFLFIRLMLGQSETLTVSEPLPEQLGGGWAVLAVTITLSRSQSVEVASADVSPVPSAFQG